MKKVSIVVLNWNGKKLTEDCLKSIKQKTRYPDYEVIVVDNGSRDGSLEMYKKFKSVKLIKNPENKGFSYANNQGFEVAKGDYYFMLNNDTLVTEGWLENMVKVIEGDERIAAVGCQLIEPSDYKKGNYARYHSRERQALCGAAMLMRRDVVNLIGDLDAENFSPIYGEELDWGYRALNAGFKLVETGQSRIIHMGSVNTTEQTTKPWQCELMNTHRVKAMLYNLSLKRLLRHVPGLGFVFVICVCEGNLVPIIKSYLNNLFSLPDIYRKRRQRLRQAKKDKKRFWGG